MLPPSQCAACGNQISAKSMYAYCLKCGAPFDPAAPAPTAPAESADLVVAAGEATTYCRNCGKPLAADSKFCAGCGTPVTPQEPQRPNAAAPQLARRQRIFTPVSAYSARPSANKKRGRGAAVVLALLILLFVLVVMVPGAAQQAAREAAVASQPAAQPLAPAATASPMPHIGSVVEAGNWLFDPAVRRGEVDHPRVGLLRHD
jgi:hypothetical protein